MTQALVYGIHAVAQRLRQAPERCLELLHQQRPNQRLRELIAAAQSAGVGVSQVPRDELNALCGNGKHQGCVLKTDDPAPRRRLRDCLREVGDDSLFLVLDGVQDPHNLGACLRSADACGVDAVIIPKQRAAGLNATVRKVAAGAAESVTVIEVTNIARSLAELKQAGVWIYGASGEAGDSLYDHDYRGAVALVMGAEGSGLRRLTRESCDYLVKLPMRGRVESLNVSVATGICLYEIRRSRGACG